MLILADKNILDVLKPIFFKRLKKRIFSSTPTHIKLNNETELDKD